MIKNAIEIKNLKKQYKMYPTKKARLFESMIPRYNNHEVFTAINDISLTVKKGEILGILGANGAGKSTLLKIITGVLYPTSGEIKIDGVISSLLELGTAFNMELTGIENIVQHGQVSGLTTEQIHERMPEIIAFADIGEHINHPVKTYSSGMFARLAFACAINIDPEILIVDEVLSVGDINFQMKCYKKFEEFKKQGKTILFVSHGMSDILKNCTRAIIMKNGEIIENGDTKYVVDQYKKLMVGIDIKNESKFNRAKSTNKIYESPINISHSNEVWKTNFHINNSALEYGNGEAKIVDFGMFTQDGEYATNLNNDDLYTIKMRVQFHENLFAPIFAISIKDIKGVEVCGANTFVYQCDNDLGTYQKGQTIVIQFEQSFPLQAGNYTLSLGCTRFKSDGSLEVFDRIYDVIFFDVISSRASLGILDLKSNITILKEN